MWRRGYYSISPVMMTKKPTPPTTQVPNKKDFADTISDKQFVIKNGGHLNSKFGYTEFEELLKYL